MFFKVWPESGPAWRGKGEGKPSPFLEVQTDVRPDGSTDFGAVLASILEPFALILWIWRVLKGIKKSFKNNMPKILSIMVPTWSNKKIQDLGFGSFGEVLLATWVPLGSRGAPQRAKGATNEPMCPKNNKHRPQIYQKSMNTGLQNGNQHLS